ncbi:hypothetical protein [Mammaliicoccus fleurettii]|uniref:hypothetical protein n=1 Tax=Mammaliicoccus fleurettii TaxID=150056 RepID=UPI000993C494|nr:hypothetical protein [Mammaliicoccus fleurettii]OOV78889.1 hypothetical protein B2G86_00765 [Mammaliicoccus fleurettii]
MKIYLLTLLISLIGLYAYTKHYQRYASVQDMIDPPIDYESDGMLKRYFMNDTMEAPIDYEETDQYKESEAFFSGMGRS